MPDGIDPNILLQGHGVDNFDPLALAGKGMSLAEMLTRVQTGQLGLQQAQAMQEALSNPAIMQWVMGGGQMAADPNALQMPGVGSMPQQPGGAPPQPGMPPGGPPDASGAPAAPGAPGMPGAPPAGPAGPAGAPGAPGAPSGGGDQTSLGDQLRKVKPALPGLLKMANEYGKQRADILKAQNEAAKAKQEVTIADLNQLANVADFIATQPGPVTPQHVGMLIDLSKQMYTPMPIMARLATLDLSDQTAAKAQLATFASQASDPKKAAEIWKIKQETGPGIEATKAGTLKTQAETAWLPFQRGTERMSAQAAARNAATTALEQQFGKGSTGLDALNQPYTLQPPGGAGAGGGIGAAFGPPGAGGLPPQAGPPSPAMAPPPAARAPAPAPAGPAGPLLTRPGGAPGTAPYPAAVEASKGAGTEIADMAGKAQSARSLQEMLQEMRKAEAQGIYTGGVMGNEGAKKMVNVLAGLGLLSKEQQVKLANTQVFDAESQQVIADAVSQFAGARIAARELPFFAGTKPTTEMDARARDMLYSSLYNRAQRTIDTVQQAGEHIKTNSDLSNFVPKFRDVALPPVTVSTREMPDPRSAPVGAEIRYTVKGKAITRRNNGRDWVLVPEGQ